MIKQNIDKLKTRDGVLIEAGKTYYYVAGCEIITFEVFEFNMADYKPLGRRGGHFLEVIPENFLFSTPLAAIRYQLDDNQKTIKNMNDKIAELMLDDIKLGEQLFKLKGCPTAGT